MSHNISVSGLQISVLGSKVLPVFTLTSFADDADPFDIGTVDISDQGINANGDMVVWSTPVVKEITINLIPNSEDDRNMQLVASSNLTQGRSYKVLDELQLVGSYPDGTRVVAKGCVLKSADIGTKSAQFRRKTNQYVFAFQEIYSY